MQCRHAKLGPLGRELQMPRSRGLASDRKSLERSTPLRQNPLREAVGLRVKNLDVGSSALVVGDGKRGKDWIVTVPNELAGPRARGAQGLGARVGGEE